MKIKIIEEYKKLIQEIAALKSEIARKERHLRRLRDIYKPMEITAIDYSHDNIRGTAKQANIMDVAREINELSFDIDCLKEDLNEAVNQRKELERVVNGLGDVEKQIAMHHMRDPRMPAWKIAKAVHVSKRTVYNYLKKIDEKKII
ncbi:DUF1492 domain-containing protein [Clostridium sp. 'deep sea']|uniref:DUF1492 domain-containing protein n=1 Tax=Clostridium sp. 'deep sea' TaxID=2779445 RepID=UPI0018969CE6|nr:DUF1492 domain-containing protein [Clostridium sp. 'deep sea']QOR34429.1 DUF1492 domain-containing protein [Clostridium sp. 'deep sea']